jgi:UDPglucose 6-dehydrogenase
MSTVGIVGLGVVGSAIRASFPDAAVYDPYKEESKFESLLARSVLFLCLPTLYDPERAAYNLDAIQDTLTRLSAEHYTGLVVLKSTVEPGTTRKLAAAYPTLRLCHSPEFLSARTAVEDFRTQSRLLIGTSTPEVDVSALSSLFPHIDQHICTSDETEAAKLFANSFYAAKIQIFNEFYDGCQRGGISFPRVRDLMLSLGWIHPMHTEVPGSDGRLSFGGMCFPKDISACVSYLETLGATRRVLEAAKLERDQMRGESL